MWDTITYWSLSHARRGAAGLAPKDGAKSSRASSDLEQGNRRCTAEIQGTRDPHKSLFAEPGLVSSRTAECHRDSARKFSTQVAHKAEELITGLDFNLSTVQKTPKQDIQVGLSRQSQEINFIFC